MFTKETLQSLTPIPSAAEESLRRASEHALNSDGSLGRARLAEGLCAAFAIGSGQSKRLGAGIELFHLASLIIDDLSLHGRRIHETFPDLYARLVRREFRHIGIFGVHQSCLFSPLGAIRRIRHRYSKRGGLTGK